MLAKGPEQALDIHNLQIQQSPYKAGFEDCSITLSEAKHFHTRTNRRSHRDLRLFFLFRRRRYRLGCRFLRHFSDGRLVGQRHERYLQLFGKLLPQLTAFP